jgi:predicted secreted hydrolase
MGMATTPPNRRCALKSAASLLASLSPWSAHLAQADATFYPPVQARRLAFPRDHGAHPEYRTEWWYLTGWLGQGPSAIGFQLTFFRSRTQHAPENPSRLAPNQLLFAHAAMAVGQENFFMHANRAGRLNGTRLRASTADTDVQFEDWHLRRVQGHGSETYEGRFADKDFSLSFEASTAQKVILRGRDGFSQKGPQPEQASHYYSRAPLRVNAKAQWGHQKKSLQGQAWLDHEWSSQLLMPGAVGWDWLGINLLDGGTLMAFRIRNEQAESIYMHVDARDRDGRASKDWDALRWQANGHWRSKSLIDYPIPMNLVIGGEIYRLVPLMLAQEVDARASTGGFYWEGAVSLMKGEKLLGRGFLELTGYGAPLRL